MHYAIFKAERHDVMWHYWDESGQVEFYKKQLLEDKDGYLQSRFRSAYRRAISAHGIYPNRVSSGECVIWEGEINLERLRVSDNFYIPTYERHFEILRVETNAEGQIVYHINYTKPFYESGEKSRLESIEEWIKNEFTEANTYNDLVETESFKEKWDREYDDIKEGRVINVVKSHEEKEYEAPKTETYNLDSNNDAEFEKICVGVGVFLVVLFGTLALLLML